MTKEKKEGSVRLTVTLFAITAVVALLLGFVNSITVDKIAENALIAQQEAVAKVMPKADIFGEVVYEFENADAVFAAFAESGAERELLGYCVRVTVMGSQDEITMMVGVSLDGVVQGVSLISNSETPGLGSKASSGDFLGQYTGKSGTVTTGSGENGINAITAATITSDAVTRGVNMAISTVEEINGWEVSEA